MERSRVYKRKGSGHKKMTRRIWRKDRNEGQKKTIEYMKELGQRGHWVHLPRSDSGKLTECTLKNQLKLTQDIMDTIPMPIFMKNLEGEFKNCNKAFLNILGLEMDQVIGKKASELGDPVDARKYVQTDEDLIESGGVAAYETYVSHQSKEKYLCQLRKALLKDMGNQPIGIVGTLQNITEDRKKSIHIEKLLRLKDAMMEITHAIMDNRDEEDLFHLILDKGLATLDKADHGTILMLDDTGLFKPVAWRGYASDSIKNFELNLEKSFVWQATSGSMEKSVLINDLSVYFNETVPEMADSSNGVEIHASLCSPIIVEGEVIGLMNLDSTIKHAFNDSDLTLSEYMREQLEIALTKRKLYDRVVFLSRHDELTGLYNRRFFEEYAHRILVRSRRYKERFCLAVIDLNGLKTINDTYGHQCGDEIIHLFAGVLEDSFRESDILGRYGGDEFVGIFLETDKERLKTRLDHVIDQLDKRDFEYEGRKIQCSFSYGVAAFPEDGDSYNKLVSVADKQMYAFKKSVKKQSS